MFQLIWELVIKNLKSIPAFININQMNEMSFSVRKVFIEISQNSQESTCARVSFLIKLQVSGLQPY